jgi:hypothetical protein
MSYKINRRAFLRATTAASALAASSAVVLGVSTALNSTTEESSVLTVENQEPNIDFSKEFTGEGLDYQPLSYWPHINFFNKDDEFYEAVGGETAIVEFYLCSVLGDFIWLRARKNWNRIYYQLTCEYDDLVYTQPLVSSELPLTLRELAHFIDNSDIEEGIYSGGGIMQTNWRAGYDWDYDPHKALKFIRVSSPFYPGLEKHYHDVGQSWAAEILAERDEYDDEYKRV